MSVVEIRFQDVTPFKLDLDERVFSEQVLMTHFIGQSKLPEPEVMHVMRKVVKPGDTVIDAGANIGFFSLFLSRLVGPDGRVHAFESLPYNSTRLHRQISLNGFDNIIVHQEALSSCAGTAKFYAHPQDNGCSALWSDSNARPIEVVTAVLDDFGIRPSLVKLDIEGAEQLVYTSSPQTLSNAFVVCELNQVALRALASGVPGLRQEAARLGQYTWVLDPSGGRLPVLVPHGTELLPDRLNTNVMFASIQKVGEVWERICV